MKKLLVCQTATILCGLLAIAIYFRPDILLIGSGRNHKLIGEAFGLLVAIFGTQWVEYQKRLNKKSVQEHTPNPDTSSAIGA
ncbi:hypothetical protein [Spirosoma flavum]|uniref:Uncharacterized protein n=1 Tax=Spirosoma flavum TaxID=2048557 RepID=A0ABW6AK82_9BACT